MCLFVNRGYRTRGPVSLVAASVLSVFLGHYAYCAGPRTEALDRAEKSEQPDRGAKIAVRTARYTIVLCGKMAVMLDTGTGNTWRLREAEDHGPPVWEPIRRDEDAKSPGSSDGAGPLHGARAVEARAAPAGTRNGNGSQIRRGSLVKLSIRYRNKHAINDLLFDATCVGLTPDGQVKVRGEFWAPGDDGVLQRAWLIATVRPEDAGRSFDVPVAVDKCKDLTVSSLGPIKPDGKR